MTEQTTQADVENNPTPEDMGVTPLPYEVQPGATAVLWEDALKLLNDKSADHARELVRARRGFVSKATIERAVAYGKNQFGMCSQIDSVVKRYGLVGPDMLRLRVDLGQFGTTTLRVEAEEFESLADDEARKQHLSEKITLNVTVSGGAVLDNGGVHPPVVSFEEVPEDEPVARATSAPNGYDWFYTSREGRVLHLVQVNDAGEAVTGRYGNQRAALCGANGNYSIWSRTSDRAENRQCQNCQQHATRLNSA